MRDVHVQKQLRPPKGDLRTCSPVNGTADVFLAELYDAENHVSISNILLRMFTRDAK